MRLKIYVVRESFPGGFAIVVVKIIGSGDGAIRVFAMIGIAVGGLAFGGLLLLF